MGADDIVFFRCDIFSGVDDAIYVMDSNLTVIFSNLTTANSLSYSIRGIEHENLWLLLALNQIYNTSYLYSDSGGPLPKVVDSSVYGNWWKGYTGEDSDGDGVGDTPFEENNIKDRYPLVFKPKYKEMITGVEETEDEIVASADTSELYLIYVLDNGTVKSSEFTWNGTHYVVSNPGVEKWGILARNGEFFDIYLEVLITLGKPIKGDTIPPVIKSVTFSPEEPTSKDNVTVYIEAYDGESSIASVELYYKVDTSWEEVAVTYDTNLKKWVGEIIHQPEGSHVQVKVVVTDEFGNSAEELKEYTVKMLPPVIEEILWEPQEPYSNESVTVFVKVTDDTEVDTVILSYNNGTGWVNITMSYNDETGYWEAVIPKHPAGTTIEFKIFANDTLGNYVVSPVKTYEVRALPSQGPGISPVMVGIAIVVVVALAAGVLVYIQKIKK